MKVFDCFLFFKENDLLEIRLETLDPFVDYFVITESLSTFSGKPKPLFFDKERFSKFSNKIIYNVVDDTPDIGIWDRERFQRNAMTRALVNCNDEDIIFISDVDEIPDIGWWFAHIVDEYNPDILYHPLHKFYYYYLNVFKEKDWYGTTICTYKFLKQYSPDQLRNMKNVGISIPDCGWHFSFLGGIELIKDKLDAYGHQEFNNDSVKSNLENNIQANRDIFSRQNIQLRTVPIDHSFPVYVQDNEQLFRERGFIK